MQEYKFPSRYDGYLLATAVIWGTGFPVAKFIYRELTPLAFLAVRDGFAVAAVWLAVWARGSREPWRPLARGELWKLLAWGVVGNAFAPLFAFSGLKYTTTGNAAILVSTAPIFALIVSALLWRVRTKGLAWLGVVLSFTGIYLLIYSRFDVAGFTRDTLWGDMLCLICALSWGAYTVAMRPFLEGRSELRMIACTLSSGTAFIVLVAIPELLAAEWSGVSLGSAGGILYMALFNTIFGYFCWNLGISHLGSNRTVIYQYLIPIIAWCLGVAWFGEYISALQVAAALVVFAGMHLARQR